MTDERRAELVDLQPEEIEVWMEGADLETVKTAVAEGEIIIRLRAKYETKAPRAPRKDRGTKRGPKTEQGSLLP